MSVNTHNTYRAGIQAFEQFRISQGLASVWPPIDLHLNMFIAQLSLNGFRHATAKSYISAISHFCKLYYKSDPTKTFIIHKLLQGMKRSNPRTDSRLPITLDILNTILPKVQIVCNSRYEALLFKAAFTLAFHALLRVGEFAMSKGNTSDKILQTEDVSLIGDQITICIRHSKTDQLGWGTSVVIPASAGLACPVAAMRNFLQVRPNFPGPLFCHFSGKILTRYQISSILNKSLDSCGIDYTNFKSHSFRIGAATTLARQGTDKSLIQMAGRWKSKAYSSYIR